MSLSVSQIPFAIDIWRTIETHLQTGYKDIYNIIFEYSADGHRTNIRIIHGSNSRFNEITLEAPESEILVKTICERFNIPFSNISRLKFMLYGDEIPVFQTELYPFVNDVTSLERPTNGFNTID